MAKNKLINGVILLSVFGIVSKLIGAVYRIPLTYILKPEGMGLYQMVFPLYALLLAISSSGFPASISKLISGYNAKHEFKKASMILKHSIVLLIIFSGLSTLILLSFGNMIAGVQGNSASGSLYMIIAPAIIFVGLISGFRGYFQGLGNMLPSSLSMLIEQITKLGFGLLFANLLSKSGLIYSVIGAVLGVVVSEVITFVFLFVYFLIYRRDDLKNFKNLSLSNRKTNKEILFNVIPITLGGIIMPISMFIDSSIVINLLSRAGFTVSVSTSLFGISSGVVGSIINMPVVFSIAINTTLLPLVSKYFISGNMTAVRKNVSKALNITLVIILPISIIMFFFSDMILNFLYGNCLISYQKDVASMLLKFGAFSSFYLSIVQVTTGALQGINKTIIPVISLFFGATLKIILTIFLVKNPVIHIYGMMIASIGCFALASLINLCVIFKHVKFLYFADFIKCLMANVLFGASCAIVRKIVLSFASGKVALVLSVIFALIILFILYYMMYNVLINDFLITKRKNKKKLNNI